MFAHFTKTTNDFQYKNVRFFCIDHLQMPLVISPMQFTRNYNITPFFTILPMLSLAAPAKPLFHKDTGTR